MSGFSPDGLWWWDGAQWVPMTQVQLTLPETEFERSGGIKAARKLITVREWLTVGIYVTAISVVGVFLAIVLVIAFYIVQLRAFKAYRQWTLEMLSVATAHLIGPEEPMLAGEAMLWTPTGLWPGMQRDYAVAATKDHVLLFHFDHCDSPPSRVVFAARTLAVEMLLIKGVIGLNRLVITHAGQRWILRGIWGVFKPEQVLHTWWKSRQEQIAAART